MLKSIITPMNFTLVRDAICQHIANERDNQIQLAQKSQAEENWIEQNIGFTIFPKRLRVPNVYELPCVYIYFNEATFPQSLQDIYANRLVGNLQVEYYAGGIAEIDESEEIDEQIIVTADENAEDRLQYLTAQLYKILCSEETNIFKATGGLVKSFGPKEWKRVLSPRDINSVESVFGAMFNFEVEIDEPTIYANTFKVKEFYTSLDIKEEYISPLVKTILTSQ